MPQNNLILSEEHRAKLDNIVSQMQSNGESDNDIQFVVDDFKTKYGTSPKQPTSSQGAESGFQGNAPLAKPNGLSDFTGKPISTPTSPSVSTSSVGEKKIKADQIRTLKSFAFNKEQALKNAEQVKPIEYEASSTLDDLYNSLKAGSAKLGSMVSKTPALLYDIAAIPQNLVAKYTGADVGVNSKEFARKFNLPENEVAKYYDEAYKQAKVNIDAKYDKPITDYIANGEYSKAIKSIANQVLESTPVSIALMTGNAAGVTPLTSTLAGGVVFGADKKAELDANNPNMDEATKTMISVGNGLMEGVFENKFGVTKLGTIARNVLEKEGVDAAKEVAEKSFKEVYAPIFKKYVGIGFEDPLGESATQFSQNVISKYSGENPELNLMDGVPDAAIVSLGSSVAFSTPVAALDLIKTKESRIKAKDLQVKKDAVESDLANPAIPNDVKDILSEQAKDINAQLADIHLEDNKATEHLDDDTKVEIQQNNKVLDNLETALSDNAISEESKKILEQKKVDLETRNENLLSESKPIKYTSSTSDRYGYVNENGVKRDLTKDEFENYESKVNMEQPMEAAPTEESKGVGEDTQAFTTDEKGKSEPIENVEDKIAVGGLRGGYTTSPETRLNADKNSAQYKENFDPRTFEGENSGNSYISTIERNGKKYRIVGLRMNNPKTIINGQSDRSGMSYAKIVDDGNLPSNIDDLLIKKAIEEGKKLYSDVVKLEDSDFNMPSEYKPTTEKEKVDLLTILPSKKDEINNAPIMVSDPNNKFGGTKTRYIPFSIIEKAVKNDKLGGQTAKQIADRGGYSERELDKLYPNWRDEIKAPTLEKSEGVIAETKTTPSEESPVDLEKNKTSEKTENKEAVVPSEEGAMGEDTSEGEQPQAEVVGRTITKTAPDGTKIKGTYKVISADDVLASHNELTFGKTTGFPVNKDGKTLNDRDYETDENAKKEVVRIAQKLDDRAISQTPIVNKQGIVLDGNNRTMSRKLAAKNSTDLEYVNALNEQAELYGINPENIKGIKNPMLVFVPTEDLPLTTETFAKFNKSEKKGQSPIEKAVSISKTISDRTRRILANIYDDAFNVSEVMNNPKDVKKIIDLLQQEGILQPNELPTYFDIEKNVATKSGTQLMESILLGSAFNEETLRGLENDNMGNAKKRLIESIAPLIRNASLKDNALIDDIQNAIKLLSKAKAAESSVLDIVSQIDMFSDETYSAAEVAVALMLDDSGFKKFLDFYNNNVGTITIEGEQTKKGLIDELLNNKIKNYDQIRNNLRSDANQKENRVQKDNGNIRIESKTSTSKQEEANNKFKQLNTKENAVQESKAESVLPREQGEVREARSEREGVGQGEQGQEPTKEGKQEEVKKRINRITARDGETSLRGVKYSDIIIDNKYLEDILSDNKLSENEKGQVRELFARGVDYFKFDKESEQKFQEKFANPEDIMDVGDIITGISASQESAFDFYNTQNYKNVIDSVNYIVNNPSEYSPKIVNAVKEIKGKLDNPSSSISRLYAIDVMKELGISQPSNKETQAEPTKAELSKENTEVQSNKESVPKKVQKEVKVDLKKIQEVADDMYALRKEPLTAKEKSEVKAKIAEQPLEVRESIAKAKKLMDKLEKQGLIRTIECK